MYRGGLQMTNPVVDLIGDRTGRIVPIYPQSEKAALSTWEIAGWVEDALARCDARGIADPLPPAVARPARACSAGTRRSAPSTCPRRCGDKELARRRLAFDELLRVQTVLVLRKRALERDALGIRHVVDGSLTAGSAPPCRTRSPAPSDGRSPRSRPTSPGPHPMHRLLQGDVGAGKTRRRREPRCSSRCRAATRAR